MGKVMGYRESVVRRTWDGHKAGGRGEKRKARRGEAFSSAGFRIYNYET